MSASLDIAKAGWLYRQSSVLRRWKKNWFVLYRDGVLRYFESPESPRAEEVFVIRSVCKCIKTGDEISPVTPPDGISSAKACMLELKMHDGSNLLLCAESYDDMKAWQISLEEARTMQAPVNMMPPYTRTVPIRYEYGYPYGYSGYPGQVIARPPTAHVVQTPNGTTVINSGPPTQVVYVDDYPYRGYDYGAGLLTGAVVGSALMWPLWLW
ncbi:pleckstrin homology domain-containing family B member 2-like [Pomacea canaliculata]|uniref:pleckstrin homology domain-containing family B member 2-like n=1 Tax=Pomacea canaliculata TaxID=400727 RepID=UPI000D73E7CB|nr:pleckstrin homology domain-containing family B member 2-like [Pomacea canaliculata]XP_025080110.1 pleckstrin homology domain-containing family B member 2-like [Pomacea canaliculata]